MKRKAHAQKKNKIRRKDQRKVAEEVEEYRNRKMTKMKRTKRTKESG